MRAKYDYWVAVQEARANRCNKLEEAESAYSEAPSARTQLHSHSTAQHSAGKHVKHRSELEDGPGGRE